MIVACWREGFILREVNLPVGFGFCVFREEPHVRDDETVANMGHPVLLLLLCVGRARKSAGDGFDAVGALEGQHPAGVLGREGADFIELFQFVFCELDLDGGEVVFEAGRSAWLR